AALRAHGRTHADDAGYESRALTSLAASSSASCTVAWPEAAFSRAWVTRSCIFDCWSPITGGRAMLFSASKTAWRLAGGVWLRYVSKAAWSLTAGSSQLEASRVSMVFAEVPRNRTHFQAAVALLVW